MPQLNSACRYRPGQNGSALVAVVVFSMAMAVTAVGYMTMMGSTVNDEARALDNERALFAAESGLLVGTRWLADSVNWHGLADGTLDVFAATINGMAVDVDIVKNGDSVLIRSDAAGGALPYVKRLSWTVNRHRPFNPGVFINSLGPSGKVGGSGLNNTWFDGPFHANTPIYLSSVSNPRAGGAGVYFVNGPVTVYNRTEERNFHDGHWGNYGAANNDYTFGIFHHNRRQNSDQAIRLDEHFSSTFTHSQDSIYMPEVNGQDVYLPVSRPGAERPVLHFSVDAFNQGIATYYYHDSAGVRREQVVAIDNRIVRVPNDVSVLGVVKGNATVVTDEGAGIYPVGDLTYDGFVPAEERRYLDYDNDGNYGIGSLDDNPNFLALVSGADIYFEPTKRRFDTNTGRLVTAGVSGQELYLTASLIAAGAGHGTWWDTRDATRHGSVDVNAYDYKLRAIGSRTIDEWFSYDAGGRNANERIRFFYDTRISEGLRAPGVPLMQTADQGDVVLLFNGDWRERNIPL